MPEPRPQHRLSDARGSEWNSHAGETQKRNLALGLALPTTSPRSGGPARSQGVGLLVLDGVHGPGFWVLQGPHAVEMRIFLILVPEEASVSELPPRQKSCCSEHLSPAPTSTPDGLEAEYAS